MDDLLLLAGSSRYVEAVLADSPIGYWRLGEASGTTAADSSGNSHPGTYVSSPTLGTTGLLNNDLDTAATFDGSSNYVNLSNPSALRLTSAFTLEAWVKVPGGETAEAAVIAGAYDGARVNYFLGFFDGSASTLKPSVGFYNGGWFTCQSATSISTDVVHHLVGTWDGTSLKIYVDGVLKNTTTPGASPSTGSSDYYLASRWDNAASPTGFKGVEDEAAIYGTDIGATRVTAHYAAGTDPNTTVVATMATATAASNVPTITTTAVVAAPLATATAAAIIPASVGSSTTVIAVMATATAAANIPTVRIGFTVAAVIATATAAANIPTVKPIVIDVTATATASALVPTILFSYRTTAVMATAVASADQPVVLINGYPGTGHIPGDVGSGGTFQGRGDNWSIELHPADG